MVFTPSDRIFPVMGGSEWGKSSTGAGPVIKNVFGTAFAIADGIFLTAGHAYRNAIAEKYATIGYLRDGSTIWCGAPIEDGEVFPDVDVAIVKASTAPTRTVVGWAVNTLPLACDVTCGGYPFVDMANLLVNVRVFKGHIVGTVDEFDRLAGRPPVYELSFACPSSLSGAPVIADGRGLISGIVIGNAATEMIVHEEREYDSEANRESVVMKVESLRLGIALRVEALKPIRSKLLGGSSLYDHVSKIR